MYKNFQIVVNTAAGRRRYMQYLVPFIVSSEIVDRYDIWINTHNGADIEFFKKCAEIYSKINLVWQPDGIVNGISSINAFYLKCIEENTIYFKLDDDITWMEPNAIEKMVKFRIDNPEYFLVSPMVINNALSTYLLQVRGKLKLNQYYNSIASHEILWKSGEFATQLHQWFLNTKLKTQTYAELHCGKQPMGMGRFSINSILWFGDEMKKFNGVVPGDDEEFMSSIYPTQHGLANCWNGDVILAHFAFFTQREKLDKEQILEEYGKYLVETWKNNEVMKNIHYKIQEIIKYCNDNEPELIKKPSPYKKPINQTKPLHKRLFHRLPPWIKNLLVKTFKNKNMQPINYIIE